MTRKFSRTFGATIAAVTVLTLAACSSGKTYRGAAGTDPENRDTIFSNGGVGLKLFGGTTENAVAAPVAVVVVTTTGCSGHA